MRIYRVQVVRLCVTVSNAVVRCVKAYKNRHFWCIESRRLFDIFADDIALNIQWTI